MIAACAGTRVWHAFGNSHPRRFDCPIPARCRAAAAKQLLIRAMNVHHSHALRSRTETNQLLRRWTSLSRTAFFSAALLSDIAIIVTMSWLTGVSYHLAVYGFSGDIVSYLELGLLS